MTDSEKDIYKISALVGVNTIFELESLILDGELDRLELKILSGDKGKEDDVSDVLIIRRGIEWEIGLSVKHNHFSVKHSRLSKNLDLKKSDMK